MKLPSALVAIAARLAGGAAAEGEIDQATGVAEAIVGPWRLIEWVVTDALGRQTYPMGRSAEGLLIYTANGQMSVQLMNPDLSVDEDNTSVLFADALSSFFAYYGTYAIDQGASTITHEIAGSLAPSWIGSRQVREYEIIDQNRLRLTARLQDDDVAASSGAGGTNVLVWERIGGSPD